MQTMSNCCRPGFALIYSLKVNSGSKPPTLADPSSYRLTSSSPSQPTALTSVCKLSQFSLGDNRSSPTSGQGPMSLPLTNNAMALSTSQPGIFMCSEHQALLVPAPTSPRLFPVMSSDVEAGASPSPDAADNVPLNNDRRHVSNYQSTSHDRDQSANALDDNPHFSGGHGGGSGNRHDRGDAYRDGEDGGYYADDSLTPHWWPIAALRAYIRLLETSPLKTKMITSALLGAASDIIAQAIEGSTRQSQKESVENALIAAGVHSPVSFHWRRVVSLAAVGALLTAPMFHALYEMLDTFLPSSGKGWRAWRNTALQLAVDQLVAAPIWLVGFYTTFSIFENGKLLAREVFAQIRKDFVPSMRLTWAVFPIFQVFSFSLLPTKLRVLVLNVVDLGYVAALSWLQHS